MAISGEKIKTLREGKAWSQAHLAEAASLSLRTVQRVEAEGTASAETRLAIAAALDVSVDALNAAAPVVEPAPARDGVDPGPLSTLLLLGTTSGALLFGLWLGSRLPAQVATHFGIAGDPDATMSRDAFVASMCVMMIALPLAVWSLIGWAAKRGKVNIPNANYWFAAPQRIATERFLRTHAARLCAGMTLFMAYTFWLVASANIAAPGHPALDLTAMLVGLGAFLAAIIVWVTVLNVRFQRSVN